MKELLTNRILTCSRIPVSNRTNPDIQGYCSLENVSGVVLLGSSCKQFGGELVREHEEMPMFAKTGKEKEFQEKLLKFRKRGVIVNLNASYGREGWRCDCPAAQNTLLPFGSSFWLCSSSDWLKSSLVHSPLCFSTQTFADCFLPSCTVVF